MTTEQTQLAWTPKIIDLDALSDDAKAIAAAWFAKMPPREYYATIEPGSVGEVGLSLMMQQSQPADRTQAALDELVAKGVIRVMPYNDLPPSIQPGLRYLPLTDCFPAFQWFGKLVLDRSPEGLAKVANLSWPLMQPLRNGKVVGTVTVEVSREGQAVE